MNFIGEGFYWLTATGDRSLGTGTGIVAISVDFGTTTSTCTIIAVSLFGILQKKSRLFTWKSSL